MRSLQLSFWWLACCTSIVALVGCSANGGGLLQPQSTTWDAMTGNTKTEGATAGTPRNGIQNEHRNAPSYIVSVPLVFEANFNPDEIRVYRARRLKKNPAPIAKITDAIGCPYGLAMDRQGTLYVANQCSPTSNRYTVTEYPKGQTTHSVSITNGIDNPAGLAVDRAGTLYVSNEMTESIAEYPQGATSPSKVVSGQGLVAPWGLALDAKQNLYVADYIANQVFEIPKGTGTVKALNLSGLTEAIAVAFDSAGNLWVADFSGYVNIYPPGATVPSQHLTYGYTSPWAVSADRSGNVVVANFQIPDLVYEYAPGQFTPEATLTHGITTPTGVLIRKP